MLWVQMYPVTIYMYLDVQLFYNLDSVYILVVWITMIKLVSRSNRMGQTKQQLKVYVISFDVLYYVVLGEEWVRYEINFVLNRSGFAWWNKLYHGGERNNKIMLIQALTRKKWTYRRRGAVGSASDSWSVDTCQSWVRAPSKGPRCFLEQETLLSLLSTGWFQERIRAWFTEANNCLFHNRTKIN